MSSRNRVYGGSGRTVTPKLRAISDSPSLVREPRLSSLEPRRAKRKERRYGQRGDPEEGQAAVARKLEREAGEWRAHEDGQHGTCVDERDRGSGRIRSLPLRRGEDH